MNERIVKLFMESVDSNYIPVPVEDHIPSWTEKFVELIVEECRNVVSDVYHKTPLELCGPLLTADEEIAKHFYGVENE